MLVGLMFRRLQVRGLSPRKLRRTLAVLRSGALAASQAGPKGLARRAKRWTIRLGADANARQYECTPRSRLRPPRRGERSEAWGARATVLWQLPVGELEIKRFFGLRSN